MKKLSKRIKSVLIALMYVAIYFAVSVILETVYVLWQETSGTASLSEIAVNTSGNIYALSVISSIVAFWVYLIITKVRKEPFENIIQNKKRPPVIYAMTICMAVGMRLLVNVYFAYSQHIGVLKQSIDAAAESTPEIGNGIHLIIALFSMIVIAPIFEEILFRGLVMNEFLKIMRPWAAIVLQGLIFGIIHGVLFQSIFAFVFGILIGVVYYVTQSIKVSAMCHAAFNFSVVIAQSEYTLMSGTVFAVLGIILIVLSMSYIILNCKKY